MRDDDSSQAPVESPAAPSGQGRTAAAREKVDLVDYLLPGRQGRGLSMADLVHDILSDWRKCARFVVVWFLMVAIAGASARLLVMMWSSSGLRATSVELSGSPRIILEQVTPTGREYLVLVHPEGWVNSGIPVEHGDRVTFHAQGMVDVTSASLLDHIALRHRIERRLADARARGDLGPIPDSAWLPEQHFTAADHDSLVRSLPRGWLGPQGDTGPDGIRDSRYPGRDRHKILPREPFGILIASVHRSHDPPVRHNGYSGAFPVGASQITESWTGSAGTLWFIVNDVWDDYDDRLPDKFFIDNIGFFMVKVTVGNG